MREVEKIQTVLYSLFSDVEKNPNPFFFIPYFLSLLIKYFTPKWFELLGWFTIAGLLEYISYFTQDKIIKDFFALSITLLIIYILRLVFLISYSILTLFTKDKLLFIGLALISIVGVMLLLQNFFDVIRNIAAASGQPVQVRIN
jgi:hypothetical protein